MPRSKYQALEAKNAELEDKIARLEAQEEEPQYPRSNIPVVLADTETWKVRSAFNGQLYQIKVKLPRSYDSEAISYPVLYVTDAETNFGAVSYIVQRLIKDHLIPKLLVVGVAYDTDYDTFYSLRSRDLTPTEVEGLRIGGAANHDPTGGAPLFARFLAEELFPLVEQGYRVESGDRALYGHSYGGLFGSYLLLHQPDLFKRYLLLSPSLWFDDFLLVHEVTAVDLHFQPTKLYLGSGRLEPRIDDLQVDFVRALRARKPQNLEIRSEVFEDETHRTVFGRGFTNGLRYLYADER